MAGFARAQIMTCTEQLLDVLEGRSERARNFHSRRSPDVGRDTQRNIRLAPHPTAAIRPPRSAPATLQAKISTEIDAVLAGKSSPTRRQTKQMSPRWRENI